MRLPEIRKDERGIPTLYVDQKPFFCYGGEIHNSSASSPDFLEKEVFPKLEGLNLNTVVAPVYWELLEPEEGKLDWTTLDSLIAQARANGLRLVLLWFGLWKNAESMYVPEWMKRDPETYFRVKKAGGTMINTISPFCEAAVKKDAAAFRAVMSHLKETDEDAQTVIMLQVENEIGVLGTERDHGEAAESAFAEKIPDALSVALQKTGTWSEAFGEDAEELFMAWQFASAVEKIASAGKAAYDLPCYTNAWLCQYPWYPGSYPSGGPTVKALPVWKIAAPSLSMLSPDVYVPYCADVIDEYQSDDNPLFIPEIRKDAVAASYALYAFAAKCAIGFSPFGIEDLALDPEELEIPPAEVMAALNIDPSAFAIAGSREYLAATYRVLKNLEPLLLTHRGTERLKAYVRHGDTDYGTFLRFTNFDLQVAYAPKQTAKPLGAGLVIEESEDVFLLVGMEQSLTFRVKPGEKRCIGVIRFEEGEFTDGVFQPGRVLNGDEQMAIKFGDQIQCYRIELYRY